MDDDLLIDASGKPSSGGEGRKRLAKVAGGWELLSTASDLLLALRNRQDGLLGHLRQLEPGSAVLAGDLSEMQPSDLLNFLHQGRRTGVLLVRSEEAERGLALIEGNVAWGCSTSPAERFGELLCRMGIADHARVHAALDEQARPGHRRIGQILVERKVVSPDGLVRALRQQTVEIFLGLLVASSGSFLFLRGLEQGRLPVSLSLDTQALLLDGLRRLDEMELYRTVVPNAGVRPKATGKPPPARIDIPAAGAQRLLSLADGKASVGELARATALGEFETTRAVYKLAAAGCLTIEAARGR